MASVDQIQSEIASIIDGDPDTASISSSDYSLRLTYMNMALSEWESAYDWQTLYKEYNSLFTGNASVILPQDFRKLASFPKIANSGSSDLYPETRPQEAGRYQDTQNRVEILGNPYSGYVLRLYGATLASGASIKIPYYASAGSLATATDIPTIPDTTYLTRRTLAYVYEASEDPRFPQAKLDAERILGSLIDYENVFSEASDSDHVKSVDERSGFRFGE
jgi:hypothetical protein